MYDNYNYPLGVDNSNAPWNQIDNPEKEIEVTVIITLSRKVKVKVDDYIVTDSGKDEDGDYYEEIDYSNCDLKSAVENQYVLPQYMKELKDWEVEEYYVESND